ncbi:MAG TPA: DUF4350 domain-containing protein, partial [Microbacterium sp.]|uniref:DUF4350 domain-containing protein n=1 Tax=Microbacterium sp. TaxID=51671 RepID=UPI002CDB3307
MTVTEVASGRRSLLVWGIIVLVLVAAGIIGSVLSSVGRWTERDAFDPEGAGPRGTRALVTILREQGIDVVIARDRATAAAAVGPATTLVTPDAPVLSDDAMSELLDSDGDVVVIDPRSRTARMLFEGSDPAGVAPDEPASPECGLADAQRAGPVIPGLLFT